MGKEGDYAQVHYEQDHYDGESADEAEQYSGGASDGGNGSEYQALSDEEKDYERRRSTALQRQRSETIQMIGDRQQRVAQEIRGRHSPIRLSATK